MNTNSIGLTTLIERKCSRLVVGWLIGCVAVGCVFGDFEIFGIQLKVIFVEQAMENDVY